MAILKIFSDQVLIKEIQDSQEIDKELQAANVSYKRWDAANKIATDASDNQIKEILAQEIESVLKENNFTNFDIVNIKPGLDKINELKAKFNKEHTHSENEVRFFIDGQGLFCVHHDERIYQILCQKGDYISVPALAKHWFDMGSDENFKCLRFFENKEGWIAQYTGSDIAQDYPDYDNF